MLRQKNPNKSCKISLTPFMQTFNYFLLRKYIFANIEVLQFKKKLMSILNKNHCNMEIDIVDSNGYFLR